MGDFKDSHSPRGPAETRVLTTQAQALNKHPDVEMQRYCVSVGYNSGVKPMSYSLSKKDQRKPSHRHQVAIEKNQESENQKGKNQLSIFS